jgi:hypothetical protein
MESRRLDLFSEFFGAEKTACIATGYEVSSAPMKPVNPKGSPVPVRFRADEQMFLAEAARATGMPSSELVRRAVRLMKKTRLASKDFGFVVSLAG